jgi:hypothetical protein
MHACIITQNDLSRSFECDLAIFDTILKQHLTSASSLSLAYHFSYVVVFELVK